MRRSRGVWTGSTLPRASHPSLSQALVGLLQLPPVAGSPLAARAVQQHSTPQQPFHRHTQSVGELFANESQSRQVDLRLMWPGPCCTGDGPKRRRQGPTDRNASESGRARGSRGGWASPPGPQTARPSLSLALAGLLARPPVAGSRPAPYRSAAHLCCRLVGTFRSSDVQAAGQRRPRQWSQPQLARTGSWCTGDECE